MSLQETCGLRQAPDRCNWPAMRENACGAGGSVAHCPIAPDVTVNLDMLVRAVRYSGRLLREAIMKRKMFITLMTAALCLASVTVVRAEEFNRNTYVASVITILRIHADAIHNLSEHKMKYSDNLVRHAVAIERTFGLLGPMEWHTAEAARLMNKSGSNSDMDAEKFDELARRSSDALKGLVLAAHDAMEEDNRKGLNEALEKMKSSCNACHAYLPESVAPDVWGTLKRR